MRSNAKWISVVALIWVILGGCVTIGNQLSDGVSAGDLSKIMAAVDKDKLIIHRKNPQGYTLLHEAIVNNQLNIAKFLIDRGADVNTHNHKRMHALHDAAYKGYVEAAGLLVSNGAKVDVNDTNRNTPLHYAVDSTTYNNMDVEYRKLTELLLKNNANANSTNKVDDSPLHVACRERDAEIVKLLLEYGADVNCKNKYGMTSLHEAAVVGRLDIIEYLIKNGADINVANSNGQTPAHISAAYDKIDSAIYLIKNGANFNVKDSIGRTVLRSTASIEGSNRLEAFIQSRIQNAPSPPLQGAVKIKNNSTQTKNQKTIQLKDIAFGRYYAMVIGNNHYTHLPDLETAIHDSFQVADYLKQHYGFTAALLSDATRKQILLALNDYREKLTEKDNLLIYYAGHGWLDVEEGEGYWLPVDAQRDNDIYWISNSSITNKIKAMKAKHVLIVADSCYAGTLTRDVHLIRKSPGYFRRIARKKARSVMTSGGLEPVMDSGGYDNHSVFASAFLNVLTENAEVIDATTVFTKIRRSVILNSNQTPEYSDIRKSGHAGGDFIFVRSGQ